MREVRRNFAITVRNNFSELESMTDFEIDLVHELNSVQLYDEMADMIHLLFEACDIQGGPDGRISFDEFKKACANMNVFANSATYALQGQLSIGDLDRILPRCDLDGDQHLGQVEFLHIAIDRSITLS